MFLRTMNIYILLKISILCWLTKRRLHLPHLSAEYVLREFEKNQARNLELIPCSIVQDASRD